MPARVFLSLIAVVSWLAVALQIFLATESVMRSGHAAAYGVVKTLSYFTILTNLLVAVVTTSALVSKRPTGFFTSPSTMSATAASGVIVVAIDRGVARLRPTAT